MGKIMFRFNAFVGECYLWPFVLPDKSWQNIIRCENYSWLSEKLMKFKTVWINLWFRWFGSTSGSGYPNQSWLITLLCKSNKSFYRHLKLRRGKELYREFSLFQIKKREKNLAETQKIVSLSPTTIWLR